jgi:hypothetical protein
VCIHIWWYNCTFIHACGACIHAHVSDKWHVHMSVTNGMCTCQWQMACAHVSDKWRRYCKTAWLISYYMHVYMHVYTTCICGVCTWLVYVLYISWQEHHTTLLIKATIVDAYAYARTIYLDKRRHSTNIRMSIVHTLTRANILSRSNTSHTWLETFSLSLSAVSILKFTRTCICVHVCLYKHGWKHSASHSQLWIFSGLQELVYVCMYSCMRMNLYVCMHVCGYPCISHTCT